MDMSQYLEIFIEESKEHLQEMNEILLVLENDFSNTNLLNDIFRVAHTIKGMSGTMGFEKVANLTHEMENLLHLCRSNEMPVDSHIIDIVFECFDSLEEYIENLENTGVEGDLDTGDLVQRLNKIVKSKSTDFLKDENAAKTQSDSSASTGAQQVAQNETEDMICSIDLSGISFDLMEQALSVGRYLFRIGVELEEQCMLKAARAFIVFNTVEKYGDLLKSQPSVEDIEDENFEHKFFILLLAERNSAEELLKEIRGLTDVKNAVVESIDLDKLKLLSKQLSESEKAQEHANQEQEHEQKHEFEAKERSDSGAKKESVKAGASKEADKPKMNKTVRVDIDRLDDLMNLVSELIIVKTTLDDPDTLKSRQSTSNAIEYLERITSSLHDSVMKVRMVPVEHTFNRFPRMVRDLSKDLDKPIKLEMSGEDTEVDRTVIDEIGDPLIHLIRNSIDHGVENRATRLERGKPQQGTVALRAYPDGNTVVIEVEDDGNGIDVKKVAKKALEKELVTQAALDMMNDREIANLLFLPGFSTAEKVTDLSGRGVGLDVVKTKIESLSGSVEVESVMGQGSKFIIRLPLTLAIIQALMVEIGKEKYAIPLSNIKIITAIKRSDITRVEHQDVVLYRNETLPIINMAQMLGLESDESKENLTVVIVRNGSAEAGLIIDNLVGQHEIVIKSLGKYLGNVKYISGATILGNGGVALIIDPNQLFRRE